MSQQSHQQCSWVPFSTHPLRHVICRLFNDTATTEIYTLSLHDALPISHWSEWPSSKNLETINAGEGVEEREPSCTAGGNVN